MGTKIRLKSIITAGTVALIAALPASTQTGVCFGVGCQTEYDIPDQLDLFDLQAKFAFGQARRSWDIYRPNDFETREQCMARCESEWLSWRQSCVNVHGTPSVTEDPLVTDGRGACLDEGSRRRAQCLSPISFGRCP